MILENLQFCFKHIKKWKRQEKQKKYRAEKVFRLVDHSTAQKSGVSTEGRNFVVKNGKTVS